jgi:hypothetical protein
VRTESDPDKSSSRRIIQPSNQEVPDLFFRRISSSISSISSISSLRCPVCNLQSLFNRDCPARALYRSPRPTRSSRVSEHRMWTRGQKLLLTSVNSRLLPRMAPTSRAAASSRVNQIAGHLASKPSFLEINTPFSTERSSRFEDERGNIKRPKPKETKKPEQQAQPVQRVEPEPPRKANPEPPKRMSKSNQQPHPALLIPGPIEFDDAVLNSMSHHRYTHCPMARIDGTDQLQ